MHLKTFPQTLTLLIIIGAPDHFIGFVPLSLTHLGFSGEFEIEPPPATESIQTVVYGMGLVPLSSPKANVFRLKLHFEEKY